jgi:hypothetical protein
LLANNVYSEGAKDAISIYIVTVNFWKIVAFKRLIRKYLNMVAVHIEGLRYLHICSFYTLFACQRPFKERFPFFAYFFVGNTEDFFGFRTQKANKYGQRNFPTQGRFNRKNDL